MKLEAKSIRYKYDIKNDVEVLKGASFIINPGEMVAVVGYPLLSSILIIVSMVLENQLLHDY
jgi:ABC-type phosphate/phosphonate transport system ATPase subunit